MLARFSAETLADVHVLPVSDVRPLLAVLPPCWACGAALPPPGRHASPCLECLPSCVPLVSAQQPAPSPLTLQIYHYLGGVRHIYWDHAKYGNQADKHSALEVPAVEASSKVLLGSSVAATVLAALYSI